MIDLEFTFSADLWEYSGKGSWHFVTLPPDISADIKTFTRHHTSGFRTVRTRALIGSSDWLTSLFPVKDKGGYVLPVKAAIRRAENIADGDTVSVHLFVMT